MYSFGVTSKKQLDTLDPRMQEILNEVIKFYDFQILEGFRDEEAQNAAYAKGLSKKKWPDGNHNQKPSKAVDCAPYPIDWGNNKKTAADAVRRFCFMAGFIMCIARQKGYKIRWGADWNRNDDLRDEGDFRDFPHFEIED